MTAPLLPSRSALRRAAAVAGGAAALAGLAGCAPAAAPASSTEQAAPASSAPSGSTPSSTGASGSALKDGEYRASGTYRSPGGLSKIGVRVTLKDDAIAAVEVEPEATNGTARQYEARFASGIGAVAVGKPIEGLKVGAVSGSSLTAQGFERALEQIRADAAA